MDSHPHNRIEDKVEDDIQLIIVSGRSGSGKSVALRALEDLGFYCIDNLPVSILDINYYSKFNVGNTRKIAVSIDIRNMPKDPFILEQIKEKLPSNVMLTILYIDATDQELIRRYSETRRLHPLSYQHLSLEQAIEAESLLLEPMKEMASLIVDSTELSIHDLSELIRSRVLGKTTRELVLVFESFGFKLGLPKDADYVFDVRFLPNPHWDPLLRPLTGLDLPVKQFLSQQIDVNRFIYQVKNFIDCWLPLLEKNNRSYVTVAIGCTGGQHRSVYIAEQLADAFREKHANVQVRHRTLEKIQK